MRRRLVIDTDIGTDVDDLWTLAMLPALTGFDLRAVTVTYGDTELRARLASTVLELIGIHVPVYRGCEQPLSGKAVMWAGHEGVGVPGMSASRWEPGDAVDVLIDQAAEDPGSLVVLAIGPLTNIASAIGRDPAFARNLAQLVVMGGEFQSGFPEHNFASDSVATDTVLRSGAPTTIVPLDQTLRVAVDRDDLAQIAAAHPIGPLIADQARRFWQWLSGLRPGMPDDRSWAHDPLALLALAEPRLFTFERMAVSAEPDGRVTGIPDESSTIEVVTDLDATAAHAAFLRCLGCTEQGE